MYTNELLEAKREAQRAIQEAARISGKPYLQFVEEDVRQLFAEKGWTLRLVRPELRVRNAPVDE